VAGVTAILSQTDDAIDAEVMAAAGPSLKVIANYGVGYSNIDIAAAQKLNIVVTNTPVEEAFDATAEATVCLLTSVAKRISYLHWYKQTNSADPSFSPIGNMGVSLRNKVCGIVGMGNIGARVARMMHNGFNNKIIYFDIPIHKELEAELDAKKMALAELMASADFICINLPLCEGTYNIVNQEMVELMKSSAIIVNTSRAGVLDDAAVVARINKGDLHGAGLDVYNEATDNFNAEANIALTAHMANLEIEAFTAMAECCVDNIVAVLSGHKAISPIKA